MAQMVKNLPEIQETWIRSLGWKDLLEKGKATYPFPYSCLENSWTVYFMGSQRVGRDQLSSKHWLLCGDDPGRG